MARANLQIVETSIPGVVAIEPAIFGDGRGFFMELFNAGRYEAAGIAAAWCRTISRGRPVACCAACTSRIRIRKESWSTVLRGTVLDVAVDVRLGSPSFGQHVKMELSEDNRRQLWVPRGFAHGFVVISDVGRVLLQMRRFLQPRR